MAIKHYTDQEKQRAAQADIVELIHRAGGEVRRVGSGYEWLDHGMKVSIDGFLWFHQYEHKGGNAIGFVQRFMNKTYPEALEYILGERAGELVLSQPPKKKEKKPFQLPPKNSTMSMVYGYLLNRRKIDKGVLNFFVKQGLIYEDAKYHNVVFVGKNMENKAVHATVRSTLPNCGFRGNAEGSMPEYSFHWHGTSNELYVFEAPIDMLSYISMHKDNWQQHSYVACCGVGDKALFQMLKDNANITNVKLCLDNDDEGRKAVKRITDKLCLQGIDNEILVPIHKDWNEDLVYGQVALATPKGDICQAQQS